MIRRFKDFDVSERGRIRYALCVALEQTENDLKREWLTELREHVPFYENQRRVLTSLLNELEREYTLATGAK